MQYPIRRYLRMLMRSTFSLRIISLRLLAYYMKDQAESSASRNTQTADAHCRDSKVRIALRLLFFTAQILFVRHFSCHCS